MGSRLLRLGLAALGVAAVLGASFYFYERFVKRSALRFTYLTGKLSEADYSGLAAQSGWSRASLEVAPNVRLRGLLRKPSSPQAPWLLFYPGNDSAQLRGGQALLQRLMGEHDWGLAVFAYRGFDASEGIATLEALALDAPLLLQKLCLAQGIKPGQVHVIGFSIGGHLAARAVAASRSNPERPASLTLLASVNDIVMLRKSPWQKLLLGDAYRSQSFLAQVPAPVLVLQGTADEALAGPDQGRAIAAELGPRARYQEFAGVGHESLLEYEPGLALVRAFISEHAK